MGALTRKTAPSPPVRSARRPASPAGDDLWDVRGPMPREAREGLERALCGVLERRYPGRRFAMKDQLDTLGHRPTSTRTTASNTDRLKDAA